MKFLSETNNNELTKLTRWFLENKLSIDLKKSSYIISDHGRKRKHLIYRLKLMITSLPVQKELYFLV